MFDFKLTIHSANLPNDCSEVALSKQLAENLAFYDDYSPDDAYTNFNCAATLIIDQACQARYLNLQINGFGVAWHEYSRHLDNIFPEILFAISDIQKRRCAQLHFYDAGRRLLFTPSGNGFYQIQLETPDAAPIAETIAAIALQNKLAQAAAAFLRFARAAYPNIFKQYLLPYLHAFGWAYLLRLRAK